MSALLAAGLVLAAVLGGTASGYGELNETRASASAGLLLINEVLFDPEGTEAVGEWIELFNPQSTAVNAAGWTLSDQEGGTDFTFPATVFPPGGIAVIHVGAGQNATAFAGGYAEFFMGRATALLSNPGDDILLRDASNATVDFMSYGQWDGASVQSAPADFTYAHSNATAPEGFSLALTPSGLRVSVPTPLYPNGDDSASGLLIAEVHYFAWGANEFVTVHNSGADTLDISFWYLTDREGNVALPRGTLVPAGVSVTVAQNATNYRKQTLEVPDFEYAGSDPSVPDATIIGSAPAFSNSGDEVLLMNNFCVCQDAFAYGESFYLGAGWASGPALLVSQGDIAKRNRCPDTNTSADWANIRPYTIGQSDFSCSEYQADGPIQLFVSPDSSFNAVASAIDNAAERIWLAVYEFTQGPLAEKLSSAARRGVDVRVFLEGSPVGGLTPKELFLARQMVQAGAAVRFMTNDQDAQIHERYAYVHAKYAVIDDDTLLIMSENWGEYGIPLPGQTGNRGWGAVVQDAGAASYFATVFTEDWNPERADSVAYDSAHPLWDSGLNSTSENPPGKQTYSSLTVSSPATLTPVLSPDTSLDPGTVLGLLSAAEERVYVEEFYIYKHWGTRSGGSPTLTPNLYLEAVIDAARRGCEVRVLLDATYYNAMDTDPIDNDDTVAYINAISAAENLDLQAKMVNVTEHDFEKIHNKGMIADSNVLISSINWNLNSVTCNRESGLIIGNRDAANYFTAVFMDDWKDDRTPPFAHFLTDQTYRANHSAVINASTSSDNVGITNYTWALDGLVTCYGQCFIFEMAAPGTYMLNLTVSDAWGNAGSYERSITVVAEDAEIDGQGNATGDDTMTIFILVLLMVPIFIFFALLAVIKLKRR
jgi:phosphatidylserine/phosphatidylglycerophosphate/cardiolipin synthase-like enzyme